MTTAAAPSRTADTSRSSSRPRVSAVAVVAGLVVAAVVATALNAGVAALAVAAGASPDFQALQLPTLGAFTAIGVLAGAAGWALVRARARDPRRVLTGLVPTVVLASLVPDVLVGASGTLPGSSWGAAVALMVMHVVVAGVAVPVYDRVLPLPARDGA